MHSLHNNRHCAYLIDGTPRAEIHRLQDDFLIERDFNNLERIFEETIARNQQTRKVKQSGSRKQHTSLRSTFDGVSPLVACAAAVQATPLVTPDSSIPKLHTNTTRAKIAR